MLSSTRRPAFAPCAAMEEGRASAFRGAAARPAVACAARAELTPLMTHPPQCRPICAPSASARPASRRNSSKKSSSEDGRRAADGGPDNLSCIKRGREAGEQEGGRRGRNGWTSCIATSPTRHLRASSPSHRLPNFPEPRRRRLLHRLLLPPLPP
uniref:Uncharacterized protein n=1 Tax=Arundo donax TaxID=35708 RepID=A0A0A9REM7_ARUDO